MALPQGALASTAQKAGMRLAFIETYFTDSAIQSRGEKRSASTFFGLAADSDTPAALSNAVVGRYLGDNPASNAHTTATLEWLSSCLQHPDCCRSASGAAHFDASDVPLPTRCIDVMGEKPRLQHTGGQRGAYLALSHRWTEDTGTSKTDSTNVKQRESGCDLGDLPQVFRDAIQATKRIGIRYLWIDCLCIIQSGDGGADWLHEAAQMASYYQQALITISFPAQSKTSGSTFAHRPQGPFKSLVRLPYRDANGIVSGSFYLYSPRTPDAYAKHVLNGQLFSRGWIFQERILSRRAIFYTPDETFFTCQTCDAVGERRQPVSGNHERGQFQRNELGRAGFEPWYRLIESYSKTRLTRPEADHLIALAGIASEFQEGLMARNGSTEIVTPPKYASGLWLEDIHQGLLWMSSDAGNTACNCGAPSWSWAAVLGPVVWLPAAKKSVGKLTLLSICDGEEEHTISELLHIHASAAEADERDRASKRDLMVSRSSLKARGRLLWLFIDNNCESATSGPRTCTPLDHRTVGLLAGETGLEMSKDDPICQRARDFRVVCSLAHRDVIGGWALFDSFQVSSHQDDYEGSIIRALHISTRPGKRIDELQRSNDVYDVLFVQELDDGKFRRVGMGRVMDYSIISDFDQSPDEDIHLV